MAEREPGARPAEPGPRLLSIRFSFALQFAAELHARQARKQTTLPYVSHLLAVSGLVLEHGGDEDTAIAALLHDAIEDQVDLYHGDLRQDIERAFGRLVLEIVTQCSDSASSAAKGPWRERKQAYLAHLAGTGVLPGTRLVSAADKLHNLRCVLADYRERGEALWSRFNGGREGTLWYYGELTKAFSAAGPAALAAEIARTYAQLLAETARVASPPRS